MSATDTPEMKAARANDIANAFLDLATETNSLHRQLASSINAEQLTTDQQKLVRVAREAFDKASGTLQVLASKVLRTASEAG